jgi:hypothetical protein
MTLREAMKLLELNERTLDISMLDSAARQRMDGSASSLERDQILEAYRRVQIFLDPSADERFTMRGSNVLAALSETREVSPVSLKQSPTFDQDHEVVMVEDDEQSLTPEPVAALFDANDTTFDLELDFEPAESSDLSEPTNLVESAIPSGLSEPLGFSEPLEQPEPDVRTTAELPILAMSELSLESTPNQDKPQPVWTEPTLDWSQPEPALESTQTEIHSEFDDSLLKAAPPPPKDETALTIIDESPRDDYESPVQKSDVLPASKSDVLPAPHTPTATVPTKPKPTSSPIPQKNPTSNPERRVSRAAQVSGVTKAYALPKKKIGNRPPIWAWLIALAMLVGTGIFAAPTLIKQFATPQPKKPVSNLSVTDVPQAPQVKPVVKPVAKPVVKPVAKPVVKPVAKPAVKPVANPVVKPVAKPVVKPVVKPAVKPVVQPTPQPVVSKPNPVTTAPRVTPSPIVKTPKPVVTPKKPTVRDSRSADNLPPIATAPKPVVTKPVVSKPKPVVTKPVVSKPKPVVSKPKPIPVVVPTPTPVTPPVATAPVMKIEPPAEVIDPNNLSREQIGRRFLNEKYYADWLSRKAQLKYPSWDEIPIATQVLAYADFRTAVLIALP